MQSIDIDDKFIRQAKTYLKAVRDIPSPLPCAIKNPALFLIYCERTGLDPDEQRNRLVSEAEVTIFLDWSLFPVQGNE